MRTLSLDVSKHIWIMHCNINAQRARSQKCGRWLAIFQVDLRALDNTRSTGREGLEILRANLRAVRKSS